MRLCPLFSTFGPLASASRVWTGCARTTSEGGVRTSEFGRYEPHRGLGTFVVVFAVHLCGCGSSDVKDDAAGGAGFGGASSVAVESDCEERLGPAEPFGTVATVGDGTSPSCTEAALHDAVASALAPDGEGTITFDCGAEPHTIVLAESLAIDGRLLLDGGGTITLSGGRSTRIIDLVHESELVVQRLTLRDGLTAESGGAIHHPWYGSLRVIDVRFENNQAALEAPEIGGGAIFAGGLREVVISGSEFLGNRASNGGAILNRGSTLTVIASRFEGNEATSTTVDGGQYGNGGGLYIDGMAYEDVGPIGDFHLCGTVFANNRAKQHGSALFGYFYAGSTSFIEQCVFDGNNFEGSPGGSGGLYHGAVPLFLSRTTFSRNRAEAGHGAAIQLESSEGTSAEVVNSTFYGNQAQGNAGAIFASTSPLDVAYSTFAENRADYAPAIFRGEGGKVTLRHCIFADNGTDNEWSALACHETFTDGGGNLQWPEQKNNGNADMPCAEGIRFVEPGLLPFSEETMMLPLGEGSPAIAIGTDCPPIDQRGAPRREPCDAGAFEFGETG